MGLDLEKTTPVGYLALVEKFGIRDVFPHFRWSYISAKWSKKEMQAEGPGPALYTYPPSYQVGDDPLEHVEFALKHEGVNLPILKRVFLKLPEKDVVRYIERHPTGKYARMVWFLYENLLDKLLDLPDASKGDYVAVLNSETYYTARGRRSMRHRVENNLFGSWAFCPIVRKTDFLQAYEFKRLEKAALELAKQYPPDVIARAMHYLYTKETIASWEIEREKPDNEKVLKFAALLKKADGLGELSKKTLLDLQKEIVDSRFALEEYRKFQNYIGEEPRPGQLILHYIPPRPEDMGILMQGLLDCFEDLASSGCNAVVAAAVLGFGFVFIHPFWDGNGRLHRFLIHYALRRLKFTPEGIIFPVSAVITRNMRSYDRALESFSKPLMELIIGYAVDETGKMHVRQNTLELYQFIDFTAYAEYLFTCVETTIKTDFEQELAFLAQYDKIKEEIKSVIDMPDQQIDFFLKCVRQNSGRLSARKREMYFPMLTEEEVKSMERIVSNF